GVTTGVNDTGMWCYTPFGTTLVARMGDPAPGIAGANISSLDTFPGLNPSGSVVFRASLALGGSITSANNTAIWSGNPASPQVVARSGETAPGTGGATFAPL